MLSNSVSPLLVQQSAHPSQAYKSEDPKYTTARCQFVCYCIFNMMRYLAIGTLIVIANKLNTTETNHYVKYCCSCWFVSKSPHDYDITLANNTRFDLSYCIPNCVDCKYCNATYSNVIEAYDAIHKCPMRNYQKPHGKINSNWSKKTECANNISITTMQYILKSYNAYSVASCIVCVLYVIAQIIMIIVENKWLSNVYTEFLKWIFIYNVILSEVCCYALFKPFQYWTNEMSIGGGLKIKCQVDSIGKNMELALEYVIIVSGVFVAIHLILICFNCAWCGCGCCCNQNELIDDNASTVSSYAKIPKNCGCSKICELIQRMYWFISWFIIPFIALSAVCIGYAIFQMMRSGLNSDYLDSVEVGLIAAAVSLSVLSTFDLFIWFQCCYNDALNIKIKALCLYTCVC
eukprot:106756_1